LDFDEQEIFPYNDTTILYKQINKFRYSTSSLFIYDFNHDGNDKTLSFFSGGMGLSFTISSFDFIKNEIIYPFSVDLPLPSEIPAFEFINYIVTYALCNSDEIRFYNIV